MALRVIRRVIPAGAAGFKAGTTIHTAGIQTSSVRNIQYGFFAYLLGERTTPRLTENSRIISIDGNLASGKGALAQKLADSLGMLYMPEPDTHYLDKMFGEKEPLPLAYNGNCSLEKFYTDPMAADGNSYRLQYWMYSMRLMHYANAIEHLITTGQGVVMERSPFSDFVFVEAMYKQGYIRKQCLEHYNEVKRISIDEFLPPHLVIYVDSPAEEVQKKLKQSDKPYLQNVPLAYLKSIEDAYKKTFLPNISETSELLTYDATQAEDIEKVAEDIEFLTFEKGPWMDQDDVTFHWMRLLVEDKQRVADLPVITQYLPEITVGPHEFDDDYYKFESFPGKKYTKGFNADVGDKMIWFK